MGLINYYQDGAQMSPRRAARQERRLTRRGNTPPVISLPAAQTRINILPEMTGTSTSYGIRQSGPNASLLQKRTMAPQLPVYDNFDQLFALARKAGLQTFDYRGKSFGTQLDTETLPTKPAPLANTSQTKTTKPSGENFSGSGLGGSWTPSSGGRPRVVPQITTTSLGKQLNNIIGYREPLTNTRPTTPPLLNELVNVNDPKHGMSLPVTEIKSTRIYPQSTKQNLSPQELTQFLKWKNRMKLYPGNTTYYTQNDIAEWRKSTLNQ